MTFVFETTMGGTTTNMITYRNRVNSLGTSFSLGSSVLNTGGYIGETESISFGDVFVWDKPLNATELDVLWTYYEK